MYRCESRTIKKAEHWGTDVFKLRCCRRLLRVPWTSRGSNQSIKEINPEYSLEAETLTLWPPDVKSWLVGKDPDAGKQLRTGGEVGDRGWDGWVASPTQWTWVWAGSRRQWRTGKPGLLQSMGLQSQTWLTDWMTTRKTWYGQCFWFECSLSYHCSPGPGYNIETSSPDWNHHEDQLIY